MGIVMYFDLSIAVIFGLLLVGIIVLLYKRKKSFLYLASFTIFYIYLFKVLDYTLIQFQSLILLKLFMPDLILRGQAADKSLNLIPLVTLGSQDFKTSILNILLMVPLGFGIPIITRFRLKKTVVIGALFSVTIELLQLLTGAMAKITFRVVDINDVIFNTIGVAIGYLLFIGSLHLFRKITRNWKWFPL